MRRLLGLRRQVHDAIDELTSLIEEKHEIAAQQLLDQLPSDEPVGRVARQVDAVRRGVARAVFDSARQANRRVEGFCDFGFDLLRDALARRARRDARASGEPDQAELPEVPTEDGIETPIR
jgi:hypothetical protein